MAKKQQDLANKLGSWADQATLTRQQPLAPEPVRVDAVVSPAPPTSYRETYQVERSLIDRIAATAAHHGMTQSQLIGYLLTWALDQVESGAHQVASNLRSE